MSIITTINGIPLFSTRREALAWARSNSLTGYHTHTYPGKTGFMGGAPHSHATTPTTVVTPPTQTQTTTTSSRRSSGDSG